MKMMKTIYGYDDRDDDYLDNEHYNSPYRRHLGSILFIYYT